MLLPLLASLLLGAPVDNVINAIDSGVIDLHGASKAQVLVIVADHGSGTSTFGEALNKHPCLFDVGEPFGDSYLVWTSSKIPECHGTTPEATFDADSHHLLHESNAKLSTHLANVVKHLGVSHIDSGELYHGLHYDLSEFFVRIRDLVCKDVPANVCPAADCAIALKMFPQFVDAHTAGVRVKADLAGNPCHDAMNKKAMVAWKDALESFKHNSKVATIALERDETSRQFSQFHRFEPTGALFDCSLPRHPFEFSTVAKQMSDDTIEVESCWTGEAGARKCLNQALHLVGLNDGPLGDLGVEIMVGEKQKIAKEHKLATKSCSTDHTAIFKRLADENVEIVGHGI